MSRSLVAFALLAPLAVFAAGCETADDPLLPTAPTPTQLTDTFSGRVARNGATTFAFVANTGVITATVSTLTPEDAVIGIALGEWNANTELCQLRLANDSATKGKSLIGAAQATNNFCVRVSDATGTLAAPVDFEIAISHF